jgi:hypothetical protein
LEDPTTTEPTPTRRCAWCEAAAPPDATSCPACGAALAQREDLGGLAIPGVTAVDPALAAVADRPMRLAGPSPSQGVASAAVVAVAAGGPLGLALAGGVAAVAAAEFLGARREGASGPASLDEVGRPSEAARLVAERLERESSGARDGVPDAAGGARDAGGGPDPEPGAFDGSAANSDNSTRD